MEHKLCAHHRPKTSRFCSRETGQTDGRTDHDIAYYPPIPSVAGEHNKWHSSVLCSVYLFTAPLQFLLLLPI